MTERVSELRERIVKAAADLLAKSGREAVSTRAVSAAAGVQAPAIYRQFGDMQALLHAAAREVLAAYVRQKARRAPTGDPVEELRVGWDLHVAFGLANPAAYALLYADAAAPGPEVREGEAQLTALVTRVAEAGRLRVSVPHAVRIILAGGSGVTLSLIAAGPESRDPHLSTAMREALLQAILTDDGAPRIERGRAAAPGRMAARAVALRAVLSEAEDTLTEGEMQLLGEWLDRIAQRGQHATEKPAGRRRKTPGASR